MKEYNSTLLFSPGPTQISEEDLKALSTPPIHHRTKQFEAVFAEVLQNLKSYFQTENHVFILNATGTGAMEACLVNPLSPGAKVLSFEAGKFGERWSQMAETFGYEVDKITQPWGQKFDLDLFEDNLTKKSYDAFLIHACETSTATRYPISEISTILHKIQPECLLLVDGITAVGCMDLPMDELKIDGLIAGSQKSLGLMTGLSFVSFSDRAWQKVLTSNTPKFYFDLVEEKKMNDQNTTNFSSPVNMIYALQNRLETIKSLGWTNYFAQSLKWQKQTRAFLEKLGCCYFSEDPSPSLSAFFMPEKINVNNFQKGLLERGLYLAGGQGDLKNKILRWGHMGHITQDTQDKAMSIFEKTFKEFIK